MEPIRIAGHVLAGGAHGPVSLVEGEVVVHDGIIVDVRPVARTGSGSERLVCPGFIDTQVNGTHGVSVGERPDQLGAVSRRLVAEGTTAYLPTVITGPRDTRDRALAVLGDQVGRSAEDAVAVPLGIHLEGPLLSPARRGAHPARHLELPSTCDTGGWTRAAGVAMVTIAPELDGALELIARMAADGVVVAVGHTDASADQVAAARSAGATHVTHLYNAMRPFGHRDPGPIGAVLADDALTAGLIVDGLHVDPVAVRAAWRALGPDRLVLVTDAVAARGDTEHPDGVRTADGVLAGSTVTLDAALRNLLRWTDASVVDAVRTVTHTPATVLGDERRGVIEVGRRADLTVLDDRLRVAEVVIGGVRAGGRAGDGP